MAKFSEPHLRNRIREYRRLLSMTQAQLALASGVSRITIARLDVDPGAMPSLPTAIALAEAFGVPVHQLVSKV